ncbi:hypothetical protein [Actinomycetospora callitridis]|uniref:hypothetical protein n=1 Tax=Actinomycetospora callitridis TaxID=913944 RepID=UPI002365E56A|nr:hypothetical protein [Actinomycetospora callitridis]MDD7916187.1 hypothetical protein [Actinomycetospora callitridis]
MIAPRVRACALVVLLAALTALLAPVASAHESTPVGVQRIELSLGARTLALTITAPPEGGGRMPVVVLPRGEAPPGDVTLAAVRPGEGPATAPVVAPGAPVGQPHEVVLTADGVGAWEIAVADGATVARIPITVAAPAPTPGWVWAVRIGAVLGVVALIAALAPSVRQRPRLALALGAAAIVGLTIAATAVATAPATSAAATPAAAPVDPAAAPAGGHAGHGGGALPATAGTPASDMSAMGPGAVVVTARTGPGAQAGAPTDLELDLTDGSTGAAVDDLTIHDDALIHLAVIGPDGRLAHVHPVRIAPGRYVVRVQPATGGRYGVFAEMERAGDGGHQVARTAFDVGGPAAPATPAAPGAGVREVAGTDAEVIAPAAVAGRPTRVSVAFTGGGGAPVTDLQGWLGMGGHLMLLGPGLRGVPDPGDPASAFGHVHDMGAAGPAGTYGPQVGFDYTFPRAGRYALWVQVQRDWQIITVPVTVDVAPAAAPTP